MLCYDVLKETLQKKIFNLDSKEVEFWSCLVMSYVVGDISVRRKFKYVVAKAVNRSLNAIFNNKIFN